MGCDIHLHTEVKINGEWHHYSNPSVWRNYTLFALMAGVRNEDKEIEPISPPRGLPSDMTLLTSFDADYWAGDAHSASWLGADDLLLLDRRARELGVTQRRESSVFWESDYFGYFFGNDYSGFAKYPEDRRKGVEDVRFIFWFDN